MNLALIFAVFAVLFTSGEFVLRAIGVQPVVNYGKTINDYNLIYSRAIDQHARGKKLCVLIGDSRVEWGVSPEAMQEYLERHGIAEVEVFNLAFPGANVRRILAAFLDAGFYPEYLLIGYSHLSFYWSMTDFAPIRRVGRRTMGDVLNQKIHTWLSENLILLGPWTIDKQLKRIKHRDQYGWIAERRISPRGQAFVKYAISEEVAINAQKTFYQNMYKVPMPRSRVDEINREFKKQITEFKAHGTHILMLRLPIADWALKGEEENDVYSVERLGVDVGVSTLDLNYVPHMSDLRYYDGLHVAPSSSKYLSERIAKEVRGLLN